MTETLFHENPYYSHRLQFFSVSLLAQTNTNSRKQSNKSIKASLMNKEWVFIVSELLPACFSIFASGARLGDKVFQGSDSSQFCKEARSSESWSYDDAAAAVWQCSSIDNRHFQPNTDYNWYDRHTHDPVTMRMLAQHLQFPSSKALSAITTSSKNNYRRQACGTPMCKVDFFRLARLRQSSHDLDMLQLMNRSCLLWWHISLHWSPGAQVCCMHMRHTNHLSGWTTSPMRNDVHNQRSLTAK